MVDFSLKVDTYNASCNAFQSIHRLKGDEGGSKARMSGITRGSAMTSPPCRDTPSYLKS